MKLVTSTVTILKWVADFKSHGSVENKNKREKTRVSHSWRPMQVRTPENVAVVLKSASDEPKKSVRRHSVKLDIGRESVRRMLKYNLKLKPYKIQVHQRLTEANAADRVTMCRWLLQEIEDDETLLGRI